MGIIRKEDRLAYSNTKNEERLYQNLDPVQRRVSPKMDKIIESVVEKARWILRNEGEVSSVHISENIQWDKDFREAQEASTRAAENEVLEAIRDIQPEARNVTISLRSDWDLMCDISVTVQFSPPLT